MRPFGPTPQARSADTMTTIRRGRDSFLQRRIEWRRAESSSASTPCRSLMAKTSAQSMKVGAIQRIKPVLRAGSKTRLP